MGVGNLLIKKSQQTHTIQSNQKHEKTIHAGQLKRRKINYVSMKMI